MCITRFFAYALVVVLFVQCQREIQPNPGIIIPPAPDATITGSYDETADLNVIFVGNSLTYENDLPSIVAQIASMDGVTLRTTSITAGNYSLDDHWADGSIQSTLKKHQYDYLVGQQGPSALPESQVLLKESAIKIGKECRANNTRFALYMVWPALSRDFDRENCIMSYTNAAEASDALLCPAGLAWKYAWTKDAQMQLYGADNFHPSFQGSLLAAMTIYASIKQKNSLDFMGTSAFGIPAVQFGIMKQAAIDAAK